MWSQKLSPDSGLRSLAGRTEENQGQVLGKRGLAAPAAPLLCLSHLKRDSFVLSRLTECVGQQEHIIHTDAKSEKWQDLRGNEDSASGSASGGEARAWPPQGCFTHCPSAPKGCQRAASVTLGETFRFI